MKTVKTKQTAKQPTTVQGAHPPRNSASRTAAPILSATFFLEVVKVIIISLAIIIPVRYFLIQPFYVKGASMEPNFYDNEYLIVDRLSYRVTEPRRGDVVVLRNPHRPREFFIKRIVGLPGETVRIENGRIAIVRAGDSADNPLDESLYLTAEVVTSGSTSVILAADQYYVLGDNRSSSLDSRIFGPIERDSIVGRTWIRAWPMGRLGIFHRPSYGF